MVLTRLELFIRSHRLKVGDVAEEAGYTRQHLRRIRVGDLEPTRRAITAITEACVKLSGKSVTAGMLFERADELLGGRGQRLSHLHVADLRAVSKLLDKKTLTADWPEQVVATGIASETAARYLLRVARKRIDRDPAAAAKLSLAAARMASMLSSTPPELAAALQGYALKERANALRLLGAPRCRRWVA